MGLVFNNSAGLWVASQQMKRGQRVGILRAGKIGPGDFWGAKPGTACAIDCWPGSCNPQVAAPTEASGSSSSSSSAATGSGSITMVPNEMGMVPHAGNMGAYNAGMAPPDYMHAAAGGGGGMAPPGYHAPPPPSFMHAPPPGAPAYMQLPPPGAPAYMQPPPGYMAYNTANNMGMAPPGYVHAPPLGYMHAPPPGYMHAPPPGYMHAPPPGYMHAPPPAYNMGYHAPQPGAPGYNMGAYNPGMAPSGYMHAAAAAGGGGGPASHAPLTKEQLDAKYASDCAKLGMP